MPPPNDRVRQRLNVGLGACLIIWSVLIAFAVLFAVDDRHLHPLVHFGSVPFATLTVLVGAWRLAVWVLDRQQMQAFGQLLSEVPSQGERSTLRSVPGQRPQQVADR
jgi:hypothetical protein